MTNVQAIAIGVAAALASGPASASQELGQPQAEAALLTSMVGIWDVTQQMFTGPGVAPTALPPAVARRSMPAGGGFVDEEMTLAPATKGDPFTRAARINYNAVDKRFEYSSVDSRAPQQMHYRSAPVPIGYAGPLKLEGGNFVAAQWGKARNVAFSYRVELSPVHDGKQRLELFFRPLGGEREFLAFRYQYTRR